MTPGDPAPPRPADPQALVDAGLAAHRAGRLDAARKAYEAALAVAPEHFDALHMLGVACVQAGEAERGAALIEQATRIAPKAAAAHVNLAMAKSAIGRHASALASAERAIGLDPASPGAYVNRANALLALGRAVAALADYDRALALRPADPQGRYNRANALRDLGRLEEALAAYDTALALHPRYAAALSNRGAVLLRLGRLEDALASFAAAAAAEPSAATHRNLGAAQARLFRLDEALASYDAALSADPVSAEALNGRAGALNGLARWPEALAAADEAVARDPGHADAHNNRGVALYHQRRFGEAAAAYDCALALRPDFAEARLNRAFARLAMGDLAGGFAEYGWRWKVGRAASFLPRVSCPDWQGEPITGKRLLVFAEQGFGDSLQFVRYLPKLAPLGAEMTLLVDAPLVRLFRASLPGVEVVDRVADGAGYDFKAALLSLPGLFGTTLQTMPSGAPYLTADPAAAAAWAARLAALPGRKVGLVWAGDARRRNPAISAIDARRSLRLDQFAALAAVPGVQFVSLQVGARAAEARQPPAGLNLVDWTSELGDFADTAALVAGLDLVVSVDTAVAHLAGALARPVWILSRHDGCWRWLDGRDDSPWYPTARLFRQPAPGDWESVIAAVAIASKV
jgi:tetratricopeptide (TPR) repeat protein